MPVAHAWYEVGYVLHLMAVACLLDAMGTENLKVFRGETRGVAANLMWRTCRDGRRASRGFIRDLNLAVCYGEVQRLLYRTMKVHDWQLILGYGTAMSTRKFIYI
uniref:Uncharacterized protein n=1 Tax=Aegilops tauschii TaxID=37682 RepID=M8C425_AEGTA